MLQEIQDDCTANAAEESKYGTIANKRVAVTASDQLSDSGSPMLGLRLGIDMYGGDRPTAYGGLDRLPEQQRRLSREEKAYTVNVSGTTCRDGKPLAMTFDRRQLQQGSTQARSVDLELLQAAGLKAREATLVQTYVETHGVGFMANQPGWKKNGKRKPANSTLHIVRAEVGEPFVTLRLKGPSSKLYKKGTEVTLAYKVAL